MLRMFAWFLTALLVVGCDQPDQEKLASVLADVEVRPIKVLQKQLVPFSEDAQAVSESLRDPFQWAVSLPLESSTSRIQEILETYALETLSLVGVLHNAKNSLALVKSQQGLHSIKIGQHIGLHEGWVVKILHDQIEIQEPGDLAGQVSIQRLIMRASQ